MGCYDIIRGWWEGKMGVWYVMEGWDGKMGGYNEMLICKGKIGGYVVLIGK